MPNIPPWLWILGGAALALLLVFCRFLVRFRRACRTVREELTLFVPRAFPGHEVTGEVQGNLIVRGPDGAERTWEMAELYAGVVRLPRMLGEPAQREDLYRESARRFLAPPVRPDAPATAESLLPQLVREAEPLRPNEVRVPGHMVGLDGLDRLAVAYEIAGTGGRRLTAAEADALGLDPEHLHRTALANLRPTLPEAAVRSVVASGEATALQLGDGYDAARILAVPAYLSDGEECLALIPHRDMLILLPPSAGDDPVPIQEGLKAVHRCPDHPPLTDEPLRVTSAGVGRFVSKPSQ